jgi:hypothetical protein
MGTTLTTLQSSPGMSYTWVLAIEGYDRLITDGDLDQVVDAWGDTEWTEAIGGLFVQTDFEQGLDPWQPFQEGRDLIAIVRPGAGEEGDAFGREVFATGAPGIEAYLDGTEGAGENTIGLRSASAFPSSGTAYIGVERFTWSGKSSNNLTGCVRGLYAPFKAESETEQRFGRHHRAGDVDYGVRIDPYVCTVRRTWHGAWVGLWMHRKVGDILDTKEQAQLVFAGKIASIEDTPTGDTRITAQHVLSVVSNGLIFRNDVWSGKVREGVFLREGAFFTMQDSRGGGDAPRTANNLAVQTSASGPNQIETGYHKLESFIEKVNEWLEEERDEDRLYGTYTIASPVQGANGLCTRITATIPGTNGDVAGWELTGPSGVLQFVGFFDPIVHPDGRGKIRRELFLVNVSDSVESPQPPMTSNAWTRIGAGGLSLDTTDSKGELVNQRDYLPEIARGRVQVDPSETWVLLLIDGSVFLAEHIATAPDRFAHLTWIPELDLAGPNGTATGPNGGPGSRLAGEGTGDPIEIKQIIILDGTLGDILLRMFASTGSTGYNQDDYDVFEAGMGLAIPWDLLGDAFVNSVLALDEATAMTSLVIVLEKGLRIAECLGADMVLRRAHLVWKNGGLRIASWSTPAAARALHTLTEDNKAAPVDQDDAQRSPVDYSDKWLRNLVKIEYNRELGTDNYRDTIQIEDRASMDGLGEVRPVTIKARNSYGVYATTGQTVEALAPMVMAWMPFFSRPVKLIRRTINLALTEGVAPGDLVVINDLFARDPATGERGLAAKPGIITWHRYDFGGADPADPMTPRQIYGEIEVAIFDLDRVGRWSPGARVDETVSGGGFTAGYNSSTFTVRLKANAFSDSLEGDADIDFFHVGDKVIVQEIDPAVATSGQAIAAEVASKSSNDLTFTAALTGFDTAKIYIVRSDRYAVAVATQKVDAYFADQDTLLIDSTAPAFQFGADFGLPNGFTPSVSTSFPARYTVPGDTFKPYDVGNETYAGADMANNLIDYKTAPCSPSLDTSARAGAATKKLLYMAPIFIGRHRVAQTQMRKLYVAPLFRSATGASVTVTVTLSRQPTISTSFLNVEIPEPYSQATFSTSSTTFATPTAVGLDCSVADDDGMAFILIEATVNAECRSLGECRVGPQEPR